MIEYGSNMDTGPEKSVYQYKLWRIVFVGIPALLAAAGSLIFITAAFFMGPKGFELGTSGYIAICASGVVMLVSAAVAGIWAITPVYPGRNNGENITELKHNAENRGVREMEEYTLYGQFKHAARVSFTLRLVVIGILLVVMLIPMSMIVSLITERKDRHSATIQEVTSKWGAGQYIMGPVMIVPYKSYSTDKNNKAVESIQYARFLPDELRMEGQVNPQVRSRGIYKVVVYTANLHFAGKFPPPDFRDWNIAEKDVLWKKAFISMGIFDVNGIKELSDLTWNGDKLIFTPGIEINNVFLSKVSPGKEDATGGAAYSPGFSAYYPITDKNKEYQFSAELKVNGSSKLYLAPLGRLTTVKINSPWKSPSFTGKYLPDSRELTEKGFSAVWEILNLSRIYPQKWLGGTSVELYNSFFGVEFLSPIDNYQKNSRAAKYAVMFISLTFLVFLFIEVFNQRKIHPIQYILVGLTLCVFFTLLLSISEYLGFDAAYAMSGIATVLLVTYHSHHIFRQKRLTFAMCGMLILLYGFMYIILRLEDYALLFGSIGLFAVIAMVMYVTKNVDWYNLEFKTYQEKKD